MGYNWNSEISSILTSIGQEHAHQNKTYVNVTNAISSLCAIDKQSWNTSVTNANYKLNTFNHLVSSHLIYIYKICQYCSYIYLHQWEWWLMHLIN